MTELTRTEIQFGSKDHMRLMLLSGSHYDGTVVSILEAEKPDAIASFGMALSGDISIPVISFDVDGQITTVSEFGESLYNIFVLRTDLEWKEKLGITDKSTVLPKHFGSGKDAPMPIFGQSLTYFRASQRSERESGHKIPAIILTESPIMEYYLISRNPEETGFIGHKHGPAGAGELNGGLFMACLERGDVKGIFAPVPESDFQGEYCGITLACVPSTESTDDPSVCGCRIIDLYRDGRMYTRCVSAYDICKDADDSQKYRIRIR